MHMHATTLATVNSVKSLSLKSYFLSVQFTAVGQYINDCFALKETHTTTLSRATRTRDNSSMCQGNSILGDFSHELHEEVFLYIYSEID